MHDWWLIVFKKQYTLFKRREMIIIWLMSGKSELPVNLHCILEKEQSYILAFRQCVDSDLMAIRKIIQQNSNGKPKKFAMCFSFGLRSTRGFLFPNSITMSHTIPDVAPSKSIHPDTSRSVAHFAPERRISDYPSSIQIRGFLQIISQNG